MSCLGSLVRMGGEGGMHAEIPRRLIRATERREKCFYRQFMALAAPPTKKQRHTHIIGTCFVTFFSYPKAQARAFAMAEGSFFMIILKMGT